jgi:superfamily II DNA or RNA helicase
MNIVTTAEKVFTVRRYQTEAEDACYTGWRKYLRIVVSLPTGMGKTVVMANIIKREFANGNRTIVFVNRDELVEQTLDTVRKIVPDAIVGAIQGPKHQIGADVIVASIQTLGRDHLRREDVGTVRLIVIDECHHAAAETYIESVRDLGGFKDVRVLGFTATAVRNDGLGMGDIWQCVVFVKSIEFGFANGYLIKPEIRNLSVQNRNTDPMYLASVWSREADDRQGMVITSTVARAYRLNEAFNRYGIPSAVVEGKIKTSDRKRIYAKTIGHENQVLISVSCLTEGFDMAQLEVLMIDRSIGSQTVYVQAVGRIIRIYKDKTSALVLDMTGASARFGLTVKADLSKSKPGQRAKVARPNSPIRYKITHGTWFGIPRSRVWRIQSGKSTKVGVLRFGTKKAREAKGRLMVRSDQYRLALLDTKAAASA